MNQGTDYYALLNVHPGAPLFEIRRAFRCKAKTAHPDAGGTHAEMVLLAEAWATLSDPGLRAAYDRQRDAGRRPGDIAAWETAAERVRADAERYPKDLDAFRAWLDALGADAARASYGSSGSGLFRYSTIEGSWSGFVVMVICVGLAYLLAYRFLGDVFRATLRWHAGETFPGDPDVPVVRRLLMPLLILTVPMVVGSWAAVRLHQHLRRWAGPGPTPGPRHDPYTVVRCPACRQKLRLPRGGRLLSVKCRACGGTFEHRAAQNSPASSCAKCGFSFKWDAASGRCGHCGYDVAR